MTDVAFINVKPTIKVGGVENDDLNQALTSFVINVPLSGFAHAELTITNWITTEESEDPDFGFQELSFGSSISIEMLAGENDVVLFKGEITALEECYGNGAPQLIVLLQDKLHHLARKRNNRVFEEQSPDDIVSSIANEVGLTPDVNVSTLVATFHQINESDLAFLTRIAGHFGMAIRIEDENLRARPEEPDTEPIVLSAHDNALNVRLITDLNHQPKSIKVNGFNTDTDEAVEEQADSLNVPAQGSTALDAIEALGWKDDEIVPQPFPRSQGEAEGFAKAHFNRMAKRFIKGEIRCIGEPTMKSGREITLEGVSPRLEGTYQVIHCVHRFDVNNGFETHLKVNRAEETS